MKILVVEDELKTLNHICQAAENLAGDFQLVGTARNGKDGIARARELEPDLIITDIKMPVMTGLEMIQQLLKQDMEVLFIILSGYSDFSFAQEAIKLGSIDYLLKPFTKEDFEAALHKAEKKLLQRQMLHASFPKALTSSELMGYILETAESGSAQYRQCMEAFRERFSGRSLGLLLIKSDHSIASDEQDKLRKLILDVPKANSLDNPGIYTREASEFLILFSGIKGYNFIPVLNGIKSRLDRQLSLPLGYFWKEITAEDRLDLVLDTMRNLIGFNIALPESFLLTEEFIGNQKPVPLQYPKQLEKAMIQALIHNSEEDIRHALDEFCNYLVKDLHQPLDVRLALLQFTEAVMFIIREKNYSIYKELSLLEILNWIKGRLFLSSFKDVILNTTKQVILFNRKQSSCENPVVNRALGIIAAEYSQNISLEQIAERCNVTYEYLSSLFSKELGIKFTTYLTQYRINQAQGLLIKGRKIADVASACGYEDVRYFNRVFKNYTGVSPTEFIRTVNR
ncbi:MAG: response regulator [Lacrimispora sp.]